MDSSLLNSFHDDPFDGDYSDNTGFWSSSNESMRQLTETLNGILPIAATDVVKDIYDNTNFKDDFLIQNKDAAMSAASQLHNNNMLIYDHFTDQQITVGESVEIITINANEDYYGSEEDGEEEEDDEGNDHITGFGAYLANGVEMPLEYVEIDDDDDYEDSDDDKRSQGSASTFRTRTDSSSIGDYESHSSDYDDDDVYVTENKIKDEHIESEGEVDLNSSLLEAHADESILFNTNFKLPIEASAVGSKSRTNTYNSDIDGLGMNIDTNNFDLADFITKDDFAVVAATATTTAITTTTTPTATTLTVTAPSVMPTKSMVPACAAVVGTRATLAPNTLTKPLVQIISSKGDDSDCDSDVIVDVETVEIDAKEIVNNLRRAPVAEKVQHEEVPYVDNIKADPSWNPKPLTKKLDAITKETKLHQQQSTATALANSQQNVARNYSVVPSKKQCDFLKGKFGSGRKKNQRNERTAKACANATKNTSQVTAGGNTEIPNNKPAVRRIGLGQGGKNLALLKHEAQKYADEQSVSENDASSPIKKIEPKSIEKPVTPKSLQSPIKLVYASPLKTITVKRKLNLEEYKQRRCGGEPIIKNIKMENNSAEMLELTSELPPQITKTPPNTAMVKHSEAVTSIVKTLKEQQQIRQEQLLQQKPTLTDPITEAKNKVLRMQQMKKAQQLKIIDSKISAKVPRVTKLPSLKEIVKDTYCAQQEDMPTNIKAHPDYEEIITVSVRSNTEVSIPPVSILDATALQHVKKVSRSLLKSSAVIYNTTTNNENVKISNQSLIASIQDVVVKNSLQPNSAAVDIEEETTTGRKEHHGEDKIIMHLRNDRIRKHTATIETQTDFQAAFPPLPLPPPPPTTAAATSSSNGSCRRERRNRNYRSSKRNSSEHSNDDATVFDSDTDLNAPTARHRASPAPSYRSRSRSADSCYSNANTIDRLRHSGDTTGGYSSRSSRRHRSSISSSYSESERISRQRQRKSSYKMRTKKYSRSSSTSSSSSDRSRTRSRSPHYRRSRSRSRSCSRRRSSAYNGNSNNYNNDRNVSKPAVEERRIVYVGRIELETTKEMLKRKFLPYGNIKQITIHHKETGMKYGFVTYERSQDAFTVIDTSARDATINMYDISFGGRRAFCRSTYADLDNAGINTYQSYVFPKAAAPPKEEDSFEALLLKVKAKMSANKPSPAPATNSPNEI